MAYSSYAAVASSAVPVNETTFLLCKPDAAEAHRQILQLVSEAGFQVQAKSFRITSAVAAELAKMFPSVRRKGTLTKRVGGALHGGRQQADDGEDMVGDQGRRQTAVSGSGASLVRERGAKQGGDVRISAPPSPIAGGVDEPRARLSLAGGRRDEEATAEEWLAANVRHLLGSGTCLALTLCAPNAVERLLELVGPENPAVAKRVAPRSLRALFGRDLLHNAVHAAATLMEANAAIQATFGYEPRYAVVESRAGTSTGTDAPLGAAGGAVSGTGASEGRGGAAGGVTGGLAHSRDEDLAAYGAARPPRRLLRLPLSGSLGADTATLGYRRGLPEPVTLTALLSPTTASAAHRVPSHAAASAAARHGGGIALLSPTSETASAAARSTAVAAGVAGLSASEYAFDAKPAGGAMMTSPTTSTSGAEIPQWVGRHAASPDALSLYEKVMRQQQLLRVREVDLLLREQDFQQRTCAVPSLAHASTTDAGRLTTGKRTLDSGSPTSEPRAHTHSSAVASPRTNASLAESDEYTGYLPRVRARTQRASEIQSTGATSSATAIGANRSRRLLLATDATRHGRALHTPSNAVVVEHSDVIPLIQLAERRQALFMAMDTGGVGSISEHEFMALYDNSPAIQLCQPNGREMALQQVRQLVGGAQARIDYHTFTIALLHLLRQ